MKKDAIYALAKGIIAVMVTVVASALALQNGDNSDMFKIIAATVIGYLFGSREEKA